MKKIVAVLTAAVLMAVLVFPGTALAVKGGNDKAKTVPPGQAKKEAPVDPGAKSQKPDKGVDALEAEEPDGDLEDEDTPNAKQYKNKHRIQVQASEEGSDTVEPKRTGISNALSRIEANLAKAEAKMIDGTRKALPPGLLRVYEKFLSWLGLTPEDPAPDDGTTPDDGMEDPDDPGDEDPDDPGDEDPGDPDDGAPDDPDGSIDESPTPEPAI